LRALYFFAKGKTIMQKTELIAQVAKNTGLSQVDARKVVNATLEGILAALKAGDKVTLTGFGSFEVRKTAARTGFNPRTRQKIKIAAGKRAAFSAGSGLKQAVSGKKAAAAPKSGAKKSTQKKTTVTAKKK
jgi:DNA-binding protein HU-beta